MRTLDKIKVMYLYYFFTILFASFIVSCSSEPLPTNIDSTESLNQEIALKILSKTNKIRNEQELTIKTKLIEHVEYENEPMVGFLASTPNQQFTFPFDVDIQTGNVGGPSAGMMMALNVYNLLTEDDITNGKKVAGTGTIEIDGSIGPVGGVKQKVIAAKRANAGLILVPTANYEEASVFSDDNTQIIAVDSFDNALNVILDFSSR